MRKAKHVGAAFALLALANCGQSSEPSAAIPAPLALSDIAGSWALDAASSKIAFASIKAGDIIETHYFQGLSGAVSDSGETVISIPLDQVETKIDIRNERMRTMFFETDRFPTAEIRTSVTAETFADLPIGGRMQTELDATVSLRGADARVYADVFVTRIAENKVEVATTEPVIVYVSDFDLTEGLEALREVAMLPSITPAVPVTFSLVFEAQTPS